MVLTLQVSKNPVQLFSKFAVQKRLLIAAIYQVLSFSLSFDDSLWNLLQLGINKETLKQVPTGTKRQLYE